jgi:hypothetical protein
MHRRRVIGALVTLGLALVAVSAIALISIQPAEAQCGSQASSCKNCHETQGQDPVNTDGTGWHESHAFGDFCYICHAGNSQATDIEAAHTGMVAPMSDVQAACAQCHPNDLLARADVYTVALGIPAAEAAAPAAEASPAPVQVAAEPPADPPAESAPPPPAETSPDDANIVDYVERYNQEVLNQQPTNWGNVILIVMLVGILAAGLFLINKREGWISVSLTEKKPLGKEYPPDVLSIADQVEKLGGSGRKALARLLSRPAASDVLTALDKLSTDEQPIDRN